ncbi:Histone deacetylase hda1 [Clarireedia jacksonii]
MDPVVPQMLLPSSDMDVHMLENQEAMMINGSIQNGHGFVDPRELSTVNQNHSSDPSPEDETYSSSSEEIKIRGSPRQSWLPTGCCYDDRMKLHTTGDYSDGPSHPEDPRRIEVIMRAFRESGLIYTGDPADIPRILRESPTKYMYRIAAREARRDEICTVHTPMHYDWVESLADKSLSELAEMNQSMDVGRKSLYVSLCTYAAALISAGGAIETCKQVVEGNVKNAIAVIRPPGHHAESNESMGFCIFNNVPIAASICMLDYPDICRKVLILDWDIHHGNGTQNMYYENPNVLYISLHVYENGNFYPGQPDDDTIPDGGLDKVGAGAGIGKNVNIGWPCQGMGDGEYMAAFQRIIMPIAQEFDPDLVIISAGFDAAAGDELGGCFVTPACYSHMTHMLMSLAGGKVAVCLEGGYNLSAISRSALSVAKTLMGEPPERIEIPPLSRHGAEVFEQVKALQAPYWECMRSGIVDMKEEQTHGAPRVDDVIRTYQKNVLTKNHKMLSLYIQRNGITRIFDNQVLITPNIHLAKQIMIIIHDPPEMLAASDPITNQVATHNAYIVDPIPPYVDWAADNGLGIMDINIPLNIDPNQPPTGILPHRPTPAEVENQTRELVCYLWDNFIELFEAKHILLLGVGDAYLGIKQLLVSRDCRRRMAGILCFVTGALRPVKSETDPGLSSWYKANSEIYVTKDHACWTNEESLRKVKRSRFGKVVQSEVTGLAKMMRLYQGEAEEWLWGKLEEAKAREEDEEKSGQGRVEKMALGP